MQCEWLHFVCSFIHGLIVERESFALSPEQVLEKEKNMQMIFVDPYSKGITTFTDETPNRKKFVKFMHKKAESLEGDDDHKPLSCYLLFMRKLYSIALDIYSNLLQSLKDTVTPLLVPAILEQPPNFFSLFADGRQFEYER